MKRTLLQSYDTTVNARWMYLFGLVSYLFVNGLFILKYASRSSVPEWAVLIAYGVFVVGISMVSPGLSERFHKLFFILTSVLMLAGIIVVHRLIDPLSVQVDRWSAIDHFLDRMLSGQYPYLAQTHLGGYGSPFPFWNLFHLPFYWLGDVAYGMLALVAGLIFSLKRLMGTYRGASVFLFLLFVSPAFWYEVAVRSDLLYNFILCFLICAGWYRSGLTISKSLWVTGIISGLMLSTRLSIVIPFFLLLFPGFTGASWRQRILFTGIASLTFLVTFLPFILWDIQSLVFFEYNPFVLQTRQGSLFEFILLFALLIPLSLSWKGNFERYAAYNVATILVFVSVTFLHRMLADNFESGLFGARYDITYFSMSLPFILMVLSRAFPGRKTNVPQKVTP